MVFGRRQDAGCARFRASLSSHIDSQLSSKEERALQRHLEACLECRREVDGLRQTVAMLRQLPAVPVPRSFLLQAAPATHPLPWYYYFRNAAAAVAAMLVVVVAFGYVQQGALDTSAPASLTFHRTAPSDSLETASKAPAAMNVVPTPEGERLPAAQAVAAPTMAGAAVPPSAAGQMRVPAAPVATAPAIGSVPTAGSSAALESSAAVAKTAATPPGAEQSNADAAGAVVSTPAAPSLVARDRTEVNANFWWQPLAWGLAGLFVILATAALLYRRKIA